MIPPFTEEELAELRAVNLDRDGGRPFPAGRPEWCAAWLGFLAYLHERQPFVCLEGLDLRGLTFDRVHFAEVSFDGCDLRGAHFDDCYLRMTHFRGADLRGAWFCESDLRGADFDGADLSGTTVTHCAVGGASPFAASANRIGLRLRYNRIEP